MIKTSSKSFDKNFCDLHLAKKLKEIGVSQDTIFHYVWDEKNSCFEICWSDDDEIEYEAENYSAYTIQDLFDVLPKFFKIVSSELGWYFLCETFCIFLMKKDEKNVNILSKILIEFIENKF